MWCIQRQRQFWDIPASGDPRPVTSGDRRRGMAWNLPVLSSADLALIGAPVRSRQQAWGRRAESVVDGA